MVCVIAGGCHGGGGRSSRAARAHEKRIPAPHLLVRASERHGTSARQLTRRRGRLRLSRQARQAGRAETVRFLDADSFLVWSRGKRATEIRRAPHELAANLADRGRRRAVTRG